MLSLFDPPVDWVPYTGDTSTGFLRRLMPVISRNIELVQQHYRDRTYVVRSDHMCHVLLQLCMTSLDYSPYQYLTVVMDRVNAIAVQRGVYTTVQRGKRYRSRLYPHAETYERWVHLDDIDYMAIPVAQWGQARSLVCLDHGFSDLNYSLPNGQTVRYSQRDTLWGIDIVGMCLRYRAWALQRQAQALSISPTQFVHSEVLPSALPSIIDLTLVNRFWAIAHGEPLTRSDSSIPMYTIEPHKLDHYLRSLIKTYQDKPMRYTTLLRVIPTASAESGLEALWLPELPKLDTVLGLWYYSRLTHMEHIVQWSVRTNRANRDYIGQLVRLNQRLLSGHLFERVLPDQAEEIYERIRVLQTGAKTLFEGTT